MKVISLDKQQLDTFVTSQSPSQLLQSWNWGEFQKNVGRKLWRYGVIDDHDNLLASAQILNFQLPFKKSYLYCPRGPIIKKGLSKEVKQQALQLILSKARDLTIQSANNEEIFFRLEPIFEIDPLTFGFIKSKAIHPADTIILELKKSADQLLYQMHPKTRYNIHLAEKKDLTVKKGTLEDFNKFWPIFVSTSKRDKFNLHPQKYYQTLLESLKEVEPWLVLNKNGKIISANLISFFGDTATYLHGASDYNFRSLMAPHLLQWQVIKEANNRGFKYYDFHGIAPTDNPRHAWHGITRFKKGFGGKKIHYAGTLDFIYEASWYRMYKIVRLINFLSSAYQKNLHSWRGNK